MEKRDANRQESPTSHRSRRISTGEDGHNPCFLAAPPARVERKLKGFSPQKAVDLTNSFGSRTAACIHISHLDKVC